MGVGDAGEEAHEVGRHAPKEPLLLRAAPRRAAVEALAEEPPACPRPPAGPRGVPRGVCVCAGQPRRVEETMGAARGCVAAGVISRGGGGGRTRRGPG